jgi:hypothetical protein
MWDDEIVEEVRQARGQHAEQFNFDLWAIYRDLKEQERSGERNLVKLSPRRRRGQRRVVRQRQPKTIEETSSTS